LTYYQLVHILFPMLGAGIMICDYLTLHYSVFQILRALRNLNKNMKRAKKQTKVASNPYSGKYL